MKQKRLYDSPSCLLTQMALEMPVLSTGDATGDNLPIETIDDLWSTVIP